jgi:hypothetical protein
VPVHHGDLTIAALPGGNTDCDDGTAQRSDSCRNRSTSIHTVAYFTAQARDSEGSCIPALVSAGWVGLTWTAREASTLTND